MDENDLLSTNKFLATYDNADDAQQENNDEFKKYYKSEVDRVDTKRLRDSLERLSVRSLRLDEDNDSGSLLNTNKFQANTVDPDNISKYTRREKEVKTYVSVDSRDREKLVYSKPNHFKIFLGKTFYNVRKIRLASIEFPNTNAVINSSNNRIYWRNQEDIDDNIIDNKTGTYPVYSTELRIGSYISTTLKTEITNKLGIVKRKNKTGDYHYFLVTLDVDTDIVTFTSLTLKQLQNNPFTTTTGLGTIRVSAISHGYETGDTIYMVGTKTLAGITADTLGGAHNILKINNDEFEFEVTTKASDSVTGGGNTVKMGEEAPFQLLFGRYNSTVAQNIGFPLEDSSLRVSTAIKSINNFYQVRVTTQIPHLFLKSYSHIGQSVTFFGTDVNPSIDGNRIITGVLDNYSFLVSVNSSIEFSSTNIGTVTFAGRPMAIAQLSNYSDTVLVVTYSEHNLDLGDVGSTITFYDTITTPDFNTSNVIDGILSPTQIVILGSVLPNGNMNLTNSELGDGGYMPRHTPLQSHVLDITNITPGVHTTFSCTSHNLRVGDQIKFYNVSTNPAVLLSNGGVFSVLSVLDDDTFNIDFATTSFDSTSIISGAAKIGTKIINLSFPNHKFNNVIQLSSAATDKSISSISSTGTNTIVVTTSASHQLTTGDKVRISNSNSVPSIDGINYTITVTSLTEFTFNLNMTLTTNGSYGIVNYYPRRVRVVTQLEHNLVTGDRVRLMQTNSVPSIDGGGYDVTVESPDTFTINYDQPITVNGSSGILGMNHNFYLYGATTVGGISPNVLNSQMYTVREIIDKDTFSFNCNDFAQSTQRGGGNNLYITSLLHGFDGVQTNTKNSLLNRSINLEGENYVFLCCPQLSTMMNTGSVKDVFARITLDQSPGSVVFSFLSNPKDFDTVPLNQLSELEFSVVNYDGTTYDFNDLDFSFVLEITEVNDVVDSFNISSRRGVGNF
jgi:hypothetical protein